METVVTGGTLPYNFSWSNGAVGDEVADNLCAGPYTLTVVDANGCEATLDLGVDEPLEFIATPQVIQDVSCFEGSDGEATVSTNGNWSVGRGAI